MKNLLYLNMRDRDSEKIRAQKIIVNSAEVIVQATIIQSSDVFGFISIVRATVSLGYIVTTTILYSTQMFYNCFLVF